MHKINSGIIGYRNHSKKIQKLLIKKNEKIIVYCYKKKEFLNLLNTNKNQNIYYTNKLSDLNYCTNIFITSPSNTHYKYIKLLASKSRYIFCEKPAAINKKEINYLKNIDKVIKERIYFNFNYLQSELFNNIKNQIRNKKYGEIINISINATHGLFFKKKIDSKSWRLNQKNIFDNIAGNLGIHYINFLNNLFDDIKYNYSKKNYFIKKNINDTFYGIFTVNKKIIASLFLSYSTVFSKEIKIYFTNCILEYSNNQLFIYYPRDTFDTKGNFKKPKKYNLLNNIDLSSKSLEHSLDYFLKISKNKKKFDAKLYKNALESSKIILQIK